MFKVCSQKVLAITIAMFLVLGLTGCGEGESKNTAGGSEISATTTLPGDNQKVNEDNPQVVTNGYTSTPNANNRNSNKGELVIKSDNEVAASNGQVIEELQKTTDELIKSLDSMDDLNDADLEF